DGGIWVAIRAWPGVPPGAAPVDAGAPCAQGIKPVASHLRFSRQWPLPLRSRVSELKIRYLPDSQLEQNHASRSRFGSSIKPLLEIAQRP
ncbi:hypothetical protein, partial [Acidovorax sp. T1m]